MNKTLFLSIIFLLSACGTKGPLYIPEQARPQANMTSK